MEAIQAIKGMNDVLPAQAPWWRHVERTARSLLEDFGYLELRIPVVEYTDLFARSIGESTDIVEKEMYTFPDRKDRLLTLRPEATASMVRAFIQHNLQGDPLARKFYFLGPMFRHERPQKGRYRQFHQIDAEVFGEDSPRVDAEIMYMLRLFLERLGLSGVVLRINSLGCPQCRRLYRRELQEFLEARLDRLCPDCARRRHTNPLRSFDCKAERCGEVMREAPLLLDSVCPPCAEHFQRVQGHLKELETPCEVDPCMVRGLDYYVRTTFEIVTDRLGAQDAVGGGGRYDGLMRDLGGPDLPGIGFAIGMERLILLLQQESALPETEADGVYVAVLGEKAADRGFLLAQQLRKSGIRTRMDYESRSLKSQMRRADKWGARYVLILGENELASGEIQWRDMARKTQEMVKLDTVTEVLRARGRR